MKIYRFLPLGAIMSAFAAYGINYQQWMGTLPDNLYVAEASIPGAHDAATAHNVSMASSAQCQTKTIQELLDGGVRGLDLRPDLSGSTLMCCHGSAKTDLSFDDCLQTITRFLDSHPTEFVVIHLYKGSSTDTKVLNAIKASFDKCAGYVAPFRGDLTVGDVRGKMIILLRWDLKDSNIEGAALTQGWTESEWNNMTKAYLENVSTGNHAMLVTQDLANTSESGGIDKKKELLGRVFDLKVNWRSGGSGAQLWSVNMASAYSQVALGSISQATGYAENASYVNKYVVDYLSTHTGSAGMVFGDYLCANSHSVPKAVGTETYTTYGQDFVDAIINQNAKYASDWAYSDAIVPEFREVLLPEGCSTKLFQGNVTFADINNDGEMDLIVKGRDLNNGWNPSVLALLNSGGSFTDVKTICEDSWNYNRVVVPGDFDNDGKLDLILGCADGSQLWMGSGDGNFTRNSSFTLYGQEISLSDEGLSEHRYDGLMYNVDMDGNNIPDVLSFGAKDGSGKYLPTLFENYNGSGAIYGKQGETNLPKLDGGTIALGDYNHDGYTDVLVSGKNESGVNQVSICINKGSGWDFDIITPESLQPYATTMGRIGFVDVNNDGLLDIFLSGYTQDKDNFPEGHVLGSAAYVLINLGGDEFDAPVRLASVANSGFDWGDFNGDGYIDFAYAGCNASPVNQSQSWQMYVAINDGNGHFLSVPTYINGHRGGASVAVCDYDKDGLSEIAVMGYVDNGLEHAERLVQIFKPILPETARALRDAALVPTPYNVRLEEENGKVRLSWDKADEGMRSNWMVRTKDGKNYSAVPVDAEGHLLSGDVDNAVFGNSVLVNVSKDNVDKFGVQHISTAKQASTLVDNTYVPSGIERLAIDATADAEYYTLQGVRVVEPVIPGLYIVRRGTTVTKEFLGR